MISPGKYIGLSIGSLIAISLAWDSGWAPVRSDLPKRTYEEVCRLVNDNYFEENEHLKTWVEDCYSASRTFPPEGGVELLLREIEARLADFPVSHLSLWDPLSMRSQWLGEYRENGIRLRQIEGHWIVTQVVMGGPAQEQGVSPGDEVLKVNGRTPAVASDINGQTVQLLVDRRGESMEFQLEPIRLQIDLRPRMEILDSKWGVITIPSFVDSYFDKDEWAYLVSRLNSLDSVVIDLRGNSGGNFVTMLRMLSTFVCEKRTVGHLTKPRKPTGPTSALEDNSDPEYQQDLAKNMARIDLQTFSGYGCYKGPLTVLIDNDTASSSEVFAEALLHRTGARVWGDFTAGEVVQAVWHPLPLGQAYALSIPDSVYKTAGGEALEGVGIRPLKHLKYNLKEAREGIDTWVSEALR